jgi:hypothetical protein
MKSPSCSWIVRIFLIIGSFAAQQSLAQGRVNFDDRGFSIVPPAGWKTTNPGQGMSLLMQPEFIPGMKYQRTLQVATFQGPKQISTDDAESFGEYLVSKFGSSAGNISGYRIRNFIPVSLKDGNQAMLYYAEFSIDGVALMQSHLLVSSRTRHYLVSFTDVAEHFEAEGEQAKFLATAWESMISFQVDQRPSMQLTPAMKAAVATIFGLAIFGVFGFLRWRKQRNRRIYDRMVLDLERGMGDDANQVQKPSKVPMTRTATMAETGWQAQSDQSDDDDLDFDDERVS